MIKGSLLLSIPIVKRFWSPKNCPVLGHNLTVLEDKYGFKIKVKFYNPKIALCCMLCNI